MYSIYFRAMDGARYNNSGAKIAHNVPAVGGVFAA
jgi:hypothetical protein